MSKRTTVRINSELYDGLSILALLKKFSLNKLIGDALKMYFNLTNEVSFGEAFNIALQKQFLELKEKMWSEKPPSTFFLTILECLKKKMEMEGEKLSKEEREKIKEKILEVLDVLK